ncbi:hypothetical protein GYMLUDRAFT_260008 [Collybiopsis luxurians FD-317 M1]|uniref:Uncharacterized protein n=1 Tax=Collybiopsis luxurians FD-317 M1 TaxID=944289 RepID=A0A0D0CJ25_9AGAR|nr:hypothetical protein GYMLUDRAFT_260008 [Collybiopsis luxurians FD-317 M1]
MRLAVFVSLAAACISAQAITCVVCPPTIVYAGVTRTLTLAKEDTGNTIQCSYDTPAISGFSPYCYYSNVNGGLILSNTGGSCPNPGPTTAQSGSSCTTAPF